MSSETKWKLSLVVTNPLGTQKGRHFPADLYYVQCSSLSSSPCRSAEPVSRFHARIGFSKSNGMGFGRSYTFKIASAS